MELIEWLFDASVFMTRDLCGPWPEWLKGISIASNSITFLSYILISFMMFKTMWNRRFYRSKSSKQFLVFQVVLAMFSVFIGLCGVHHFFYAMGFWKNPYRAMTILIDFPMGLVSLAAAIAFFPVSKIISEMDPPEIAREKERIIQIEHDRVFKENARIVRELLHIKRNVENVIHLEKLARLNSLIDSLKKPI